MANAEHDRGAEGSSADHAAVGSGSEGAAVRGNVRAAQGSGTDHAAADSGADHAAEGSGSEGASVRGNVRATQGSGTDHAAVGSGVDHTAEDSGSEGASVRGNDSRPRVLRVVRPGPRTTVQDRGRPGHAALGVGRSGAADQRSFALANRLLGNDPDAACLETTLGGLTVEVDHATWFAVTGPRVDVLCGGRPVGHNTAFFAAAGSIVAIGTPTRGMRNYLAVRGGIDVHPLLGSRSTDLLGGLGPATLSAGDRLPVGRAEASDFGVLDVVPVAEPPEHPVLVVDPGPRLDWFTADAWSIFTGSTYTATTESDRIGVRFDGPTLPRTDDRELPSEGLMQGAVQVPPKGTPVVFLADQPTTGGYPVIGVVRRSSLDVLAQVRPGTPVRFRRG